MEVACSSETCLILRQNIWPDNPTTIFFIVTAVRAVGQVQSSEKVVKKLIVASFIQKEWRNTRRTIIVITSALTKIHCW
jgi:hypothetical protein